VLEQVARAIDGDAEVGDRGEDVVVEGRSGDRFPVGQEAVDLTAQDVVPAGAA
jgi:hypothetical protein